MTRPQKNSQQLYRRAREIILGGTQTISKQPERFDPEFFPTYIDHGRGGRLWDIDGNEFLDFVMALGPILLGYCHPAVDEAVREQLSRGVLFSGNSSLEVDLAEKLIQLIPNAERVRFFKTGAEANAAALRISRNFTGRDKVISCGYQGWHDSFLAKMGEPGIPKAFGDFIVDLKYGDRTSAHALFDRFGAETACVIVEPTVLNLDAEFLRELAQLAIASGALLVFDEIITGFRLGLGGLQEYIGLRPDLAVFGKCLANGFPLSVLTGRKDVFESAEDLWISSTFGGEALSLAAALATIAELERSDALQRMWGLGKTLREEWQTLLSNSPEVDAEVIGLDPLPVLRFKSQARAQEDIFIREMLKQGVLIRRKHYWFLTASHTKSDIEQAIAATKVAFRKIQESTVAHELLHVLNPITS